MHQVIIGTDPEVFLRSIETKKIVSAHDRIPGEKTNPHRVPNGAIQVDGLAAEFNTDPAKTADEFLAFIESVLGSIKSHAGPDVEVVIEPTAWFDQEYFDSLPEFPKLLGCTPDYDAYTGQKSPPPGTTEPFRTGAGHIHLGWTEEYNPTSKRHFSVCRDIVMQMDAVIYPTSLLWDYDQKRRELYGRIGAFRPKFYGVEYRSVSNAYLREKSIQRWVFEASKFSAEEYLNNDVRFYDEAFVRDFVAQIYSGWVPEKDVVRGYLRDLQKTFGTPLFL